jgi:hypothetical protein
MESVRISFIAFGFVFGGAVAGMILRVRLTERQFSNDAKDVIKLGIGLIATMNALVLGLLVSTAKSSYDAKRTHVTQLAANAILVDRTLALYGSDTKEARGALRDLVSSAIDQIRSIRGDLPRDTLSKLKVGATDFYQAVAALSPHDEERKSLKAEALRITFQIAEIRALAFAQRSSSIPSPFLVVLVFWLTILFMGFGLFAPLNTTGVVAMSICALSVSAAIFLILDMDQPFGGVMQISSEPLRNAMIVITR